MLTNEELIRLWDDAVVTIATVAEDIPIVFGRLVEKAVTEYLMVPENYINEINRRVMSGGPGCEQE